MMAGGGKGGGGGKSQVRGYKYLFDILMGLCRGPIDQVVAIKVGDIEVWPGTGTYTAPDPGVIVQQTGTPGPPYPDGSYADESGAPLVDNQRFGINKPNAFGGDAGEGGIAGNALLQMGGRDQVVTDDVKNGIAGTDISGTIFTYDTNGLRTQANPNWVYDNAGVGHDTNPLNSGGTRMPAPLISDMRGLATMWFSGQVCSNNPYPKTWKIRVRRTYQGWDEGGCWYPAKAQIVFNNSTGQIRAMNPAHIIYEIITNKTWGRGMDRAEMDDAGFTYAANLLYDEGFGLCIKWGRGEDINAIIQMVIDHISAVLYVDRSTGLMTLRLLRGDYNEAELPSFDYTSGLLRADGIQSGVNLVTANEVIVKFHDPNYDQERMCRVHNLASIQSIGEKVTETKSYLGIPDPTLARRVALRDLQVASAGAKKIKLYMDRRGWRLQPGSVFSVSIPDKGIARMTLRVITYDDGTLTNGTITLECVQDVFGMPSTVFTSEAPAEYRGGKAPDALPTRFQIAYEASYYDMVKGLSAADAATVTADEGGIVIATGKPTASALGSTITSTPSGGTADQASTSVFSPVGIVRAAVGYYDTTIPLRGGTDLGDVKPNTAAVIGGEVVKVIALDTATGIVTIARGAVDTIPQEHPAGSFIYFNDVVHSVYTPAYAAGENVSIQVTPRTQTTAGAVNAPPIPVTITGRHAKPYPPANVRINGDLALVNGGYFVSNGQVALTWYSRNKVLQADQLLGTLDGPVLAETGTSYTVRVSDPLSGTLLYEQTGITDTQAAVNLTALGGAGYGNSYDQSYGVTVATTSLDLQLFTVVNGLDSTAYHIAVVPVDAAAAGFGGVYGYSYG